MSSTYRFVGVGVGPLLPPVVCFFILFRWYYISRDAEIGAAVVVFWEDDVEVVP